MIPMLARIHIVRETSRGVRLWVPLFVLWLIALPFVLLALPFLWIALRVNRMKPSRTLRLFWHVFASLRGTQVEAGDGHDSVLVKIW